MASKNPKLHQVNMLRVQKLHQEHKKKQTVHEKKYSNLETKHKDAQKELHDLKLAFDGDYAFRYKEDKREAMARARKAKSDSKRKQQELKKSRVVKKESPTS